jgi:hypothetical protein
MTDVPTTPPAKRTGGMFKKGVSGNPGGRKKAVAQPQAGLTRVSRVADGSEVWLKAAPAPQAPQVGPQAASAEGTHAKVEQPENTGRKPDGTFAMGNSINPAGRPKGSLNKSTMAALAIMEADAETISRKAVELALGGDLTAIRIVLDRLVAPGETGPLRSRSPRSSPRRTWSQQPRQSWKQSQTAL